LKLSSHEAILVTTQVSDRIGVPRPIRLTVRPEGHSAAIEQIMDATLKLTLLHHGALKPPRLPMLLHGADRLADLRLNGVYVLECDRQFWL
jgi:argonaute-like protein implicated in RNA metabolism and viral defense